MGVVADAHGLGAGFPVHAPPADRRGQTACNARTENSPRLLGAPEAWHETVDRRRVGNAPADVSLHRQRLVYGLSLGIVREQLRRRQIKSLQAAIETLH